jgi:hypothetical protein
MELQAAQFTRNIYDAQALLSFPFNDVPLLFE